MNFHNIMNYLENRVSLEWTGVHTSTFKIISDNVYLIRFNCLKSAFSNELHMFDCLKQTINRINRRNDININLKIKENYYNDNGASISFSLLCINWSD